MMHAPVIAHAPDGTASGRWPADSFTGKFTGSHFSGSYSSGECGAERAISLDKAG
jgi:hypothetical protein